MSHTSKFPPLKYTTSTLPTDLPVGTVALDATTNEHKSFNGSSWDVIEGGSIGTPTIVFDSTGPSYDQIQGDIPEGWKLYGSSLKGLVIGTSCTSIGIGAFSNCDLTGSLVIPDSVTRISTNAFHGCINISSLVLSDNLLSISGFAFSSCSGLTGSLTIPNSVTSIAISAFDGCTGLTSLTIGNSVTTIGGSAFSGCSGLTGSLTIPDSVTSIGAGAFVFCPSLNGTLTIPNSVTSIGASAFQNCTSLPNVDCYVEKSVLDVANPLLDTSVTTIHVRSTDSTWTAGAGQTIGGKTGITVIKDL